MLTLKIKESMEISNLAILMVGVFLMLGIFYTDRLIGHQFKSSMITLDSLLPSKNDNK